MVVKVYRISTCHWCDKVEAFLKRHNIGFESIVIDLMEGEAQEKALAEAYRLSKQRSFPVTYIDGTCVIGFHESKLRSLLKVSPGEEETEEGADKGCLCLDEDRQEAIEKMREWLLQEAKSYGFKINPDMKLVDDLLRGLVVNEKRYGYKACPCRLAIGKYKMDSDIICPCPYCFSDVEKYGRCYCGLFVSDRFMSSDTSLPEYIPDSRESKVVEEVSKGLKERVSIEAAATAISIRYKSHTKVFGFTKDGSDREKIKEDFLNILHLLKIDTSRVQWHERTVYASGVLHGVDLIVKLNEDTDMYSYQITCKAIGGKTVDGEVFFKKIDFTEQKNKLFECYIIVPDTVEECAQILLPEKKYLSSIYHRYQIAVGFESEGARGDIFIANPEDIMFDRVAEDIIALESNYYLLSIEKQRYILAVDKLDVLESTIVTKMGIISMNLPKSLPETLKEWLHGLSNNFSEISGIAEESRHRMNHTIMKRDMMRKIFKDWDESPSDFRHPVISSFYKERVDNLGDQYQSLFLRIDGIRREMADLISMLRTKIDLTLQEQSLELQSSANETLKTQMRMQHMVEGLSIIALSYYTVHLTGFVFESLETGHILHISATTMKAFFVPVAIALSWFLTFRARRIIKEFKDRKMK